MTNEQSSTLRVGVIGLGMIGGGIAQCYARHNSRAATKA